MPEPQTALKFEVEVSDKGRIEIAVPFPAGSRVLVFVVEQGEDNFTDFLTAAQSSTGFWDNTLDDEDWNNA